MKYSFVDLGGYRAVTQCPRCEIYYALTVEEEQEHDQVYRLICPYCNSGADKSFLRELRGDFLME